MGGAHHWIKQRCLAGIGEFVETRFCKMFLVKHFKCLLVAFLLLSASPTTLSHGQEYQSANGANQRAPICVAYCTITLVAMIMLVCFLVTHSYAATQTWITTSTWLHVSVPQTFIDRSCDYWNIHSNWQSPG